MKTKLSLLLAFAALTDAQSATGLYQEAGTSYVRNYAEPIKEEKKSDDEEGSKKVEKLQLIRTPLSNYALYKHIFTNFGQAINASLSPIINSNLIKDLALLVGEHESSSSIINVITEFAITDYAKAFTAGLLIAPTSEKATLQKRQEILREFLVNQSLERPMQKSLEIIKATENSFFNYFEEENKLMKKTIDARYWSMFSKSMNDRLNKSFAANQTGHFLTNVNNTKNIWLNLVIFKIQTIGTLYYFKNTTEAQVNKAISDMQKKGCSSAKIEQAKKDFEFVINQQRREVEGLLPESNPMKAYDPRQPIFPGLPSTDFFNIGMKGLMYYGLGVGLHQTYTSEKVLNDLTNYLHEDLNNMANMISALRELDTLVQTNSVLRANLAYAQDLHALFDVKNTKRSAKMNQLIALFDTSTFKSAPAYFSLKGRVITAHKLMKEIKEEFIPALHAAGEVDAYLGLSLLYKEHENTDTPYSFVEYIAADSPSVVIEDMWNPLVNTQTSNKRLVKNSIKLGGASKQNVILTGPNAGGKSTFLKGTTISVVLGQTLGIAPARYIAFTPFAKINTYMNITDDTAAGKSLFKAEVERAQALLSTIINLGSKGFSFSIMDEMFSGTSPKEGEAASYAVAKKLGTLPNSIMLLATHFQMLKNLEPEAGTFKNYQVRIIRHKDGSFSYPFKLEEGAADQNVAIDLLKQEGFDTSILDEAQDILSMPVIAA